jgi:hypothetical protein
MQIAEVTLPGGFSVGGEWHRTAALRPLVGADEAFLLEEGKQLSPPARWSALLARCLKELGPMARVDRATAATLAVGDREALFLHLRRLTFGEQISCVLQCPEPSCRAKMDLDLTVSELLLPPYMRAAEIHETVVDAADGRYRVTFRLPKGSDQEAAAPLAAKDLKAAEELILERTIQTVTELANGLPPKQVPEAVKQALPAKMAEIDRQAEMLLKLSCPECGRSFTVPFEAAEYFEQEVLARQSQLFREVHLLAFHYHWNETEILRMSGTKRRLYIGLLTSELAERGRA